MGILLAIALIILALSILIVIHELGHFWAARMFGIRVESFALFFGKKLWGIKRGDTEWRINAVPLGGYVKISGMLDEHMDEEQMNAEPQPWEFRSKPIWQRLIVMLGGIIMNVILGIVIFIFYMFFVGERKIPFENVQHGLYVHENTIAHDLGFRTGDKIKNYMGEKAIWFSDYTDPNNLVDRGKYFIVDRNGTEKRIDIPNDFINDFQESGERTLFSPDMPPIIFVRDTGDYKDWHKIEPEKKAKVVMQGFLGGMRDRDKIISIDSIAMPLYSQAAEYVKDKPNQTIDIQVERAGKLIDLKVTSNDSGLIGFGPYEDTLKVQVDYSFGESIPRGVSMAFSSVTNTVKGLVAVFTGNADPSKSLSGPIQIAGFYERIYAADGWAGFWRLTGLLSMVLAVMNLLPIPVLDGGQVVILLIEGIIGR
ncbi:MAG: RIP metalloprotease RseP, partial [Bacteroidota bacterium]